MAEATPFVTSLWCFVALPLSVAFAATVAVRLRLPPFQLRRALRGITPADADAPGALGPASALLIASTASFGAAGVVGAADAIAMGGIGVLPWLWLLTLAMGPIRFVATFLARTRSVGRRSGPTGSLARRLRAEGGPWTTLANVLSGVLLLSALAVVCLTHGRALADAVHTFDPSLESWIGGSLVAAALIVGVLGPAKGGAGVALVVVAALFALIGLGLWAGLSQPGRWADVLFQSVPQMIGGAPSIGTWSGTSARETFEAASLGFFPPLATATLVDANVHGLARASTSRGQATVATIGPLIALALGTTVGVACASTGAYWKLDRATVPLDSVTFYRGGFQTASQRVEESRHYHGYVRIGEGRTTDPDVRIASPRAVIDRPRVTHNGHPADLALQIERGRIRRLLVKHDTLLRQTPVEEAARMGVGGAMPPAGAQLIRRAIHRGSGSRVAGAGALIAILVLAIAGAIAWSWGTVATLPPRFRRTRVVTAMLPAAGLTAALLLARWPLRVDPLDVGFLGPEIVSVLLALITVGVLAGRARDAR